MFHPRSSPSGFILARGAGREEPEKLSANHVSVKAAAILSEDRSVTWAVLLGIPALCIAFLINRRSMWLDETASVYAASRDAAGMIHMLAHIDGVFAFYYALLHVWMIFGDSAVWVRLLSVLFALGTLPIYYAIMQRLLDRQIAFISTFALGTSFMFFRYAVETRAYSMELFFCSLSLFYFLKSHDEQRARYYIWYVIATAAAIYAHPLAVLWPVAQGASIVFLPASRGFLKGMLVCWAGIAALLVPLAMVVHLNGVHQIDWILPLSPGLLIANLAVLLGGPLGGPFGHWELALLIALLIAIGSALLWRSKRELTLVLLTWLLLPLAIMAVVSIWKPIEQVYYFRYTLLPAFGLAAVAIAWAAQRFGRMAETAILALMLAGGLTQMLAATGEDWRSASAVLQDRMKPADGLIVYSPFAITPLRYAAKERNVTIPGKLLFPLDVEPADGFPSGSVPHGLPREAAAHYRRVWLVLSHGKTKWEKDVLAPLRPFYAESTRVNYRTIVIVELQNRRKLESPHLGR